jgi:hypothetical protein
MDGRSAARAPLGGTDVVPFFPHSPGAGLGSEGWQSGGIAAYLTFNVMK